jgi:hypothetical protein
MARLISLIALLRIASGQFGGPEGTLRPLDETTVQSSSLSVGEEMQLTIDGLRAQIAALKTKDPFRVRHAVHDDGHTGPVVLSYHDTTMNNKDDFDAGLTTHTIDTHGNPVGQVFSNARCETVPNGQAFDGDEIHDYDAGHRHQHPTFAAGPEDCCIICSLQPQCAGWTFSMEETIHYNLDDLPEGKETYAMLGPNKAGNCHHYSTIHGTGPCESKQCVSGYQGKITIAKPDPATVPPSTAVVMRTVAKAMPMRHILLWGKQLEGIADLWVSKRFFSHFCALTSVLMPPQAMVDVGNCEANDDDCKNIPAEIKMAENQPNIKFWTYTPDVFNTWSAGHTTYKRKEPKINWGWPSLSLVYWADHLPVIPQFVWLLEVRNMTHPRALFDPV